MDDLIKNIDEIKSRENLLSVLNKSKALLSHASSFSVVLFYSELMRKAFIPSIRSFLTSKEVNDNLYSIFLIRSKETIEVVSLLLGNINEGTNNNIFIFENISNLLKIILQSDLSILFINIDDEEELKTFLDVFLNIRIKICNLRGVFKNIRIIDETLRNYDECYINITKVLIKLKKNYIMLYYFYKISQFNEKECYRNVKALYEISSSDIIAETFNNFIYLNIRCYQYLFMILLKSDFSVEELKIMYHKQSTKLLEISCPSIDIIIQNITNSIEKEYFKKFISLLKKCISSEEYVNIVTFYLEKFENQLDMPDFVTVIQLLNVVSALKLMIRNMTECEKNCIKSRIENFLINCFNSLYSAEEARKQIMWHFIEWYKNEVKCYEDKFKNIKDFQEEGMIKSWELEFLEHIFDEPDIIISPPNKEIIVEQQNVTPETYEEIDSDDDLPQFLKSTCILKQETKSNDLDSDDEVEEKYKEFYYIMDCINELSSTENRLVFIGGIKSLDKLMKKKSLGYKEFSSIIIEMFLKIREDFYFEEFEEHRRSILVTTLFHNPNLIISFIESTTTKNMSDFERLLRLDIINLTCAKLKKEDSQTFHLLISDIIFSLSFAFNVNSALSSEIDKNQTTFIKIILTIGDLLRLAENTPQIVLINSKIFRILKLIRSYKNHIFVTACMEVYIIITKSCEKSILIDNFSGELKEIQGWIINLTNSVNSIMNDEKSMTKMDKFTQYDYASNLLSNIQSILCFK